MDERIYKLNQKDVDKDGSFVAYVMSRDQRLKDNHALLVAQKMADEQQVPLRILFCLYTPQRTTRAREHYQFMVEGLKQVAQSAQEFNIGFELLIGKPQKTITKYLLENHPQAVVFDFSPLKGPRKLQKSLASSLDCQAIVVDTHNIVPVWVASDRQEYAARTIRSKINNKLTRFQVEPSELKLHSYADDETPRLRDKQLSQIDELLKDVESNQINVQFDSGESAAYKHIEDFIANDLGAYHEDRNDPSNDGLSGLSPYLHFGQISSLRVALMVEEAVARDSSLQSGADTLLEEMIVRKELSDNFCFYAGDYKSLESAADWAQETLAAHADDRREHTYTFTELRDAKTHDTAWNAAQTQLRRTGKMHGYMRMYWAKKVLEWSPIEPTGDSDRFGNLCAATWAIAVLVYLNDYYSIDGGDPNGYTGIMWSVAGIHDQGWQERPIFGKIRYMNYKGLKRKFDIEAYEQAWNNQQQLEV